MIDLVQELQSDQRLHARPRVGLTEAHKLGDVQRFFMLLSPSSRPGAPSKLIPIGKKRLPDPATHERFFGFVQTTASKV
jgi:hypothetical protein